MFECFWWFYDNKRGVIGLQELELNHHGQKFMVDGFVIQAWILCNAMKRMNVYDFESSHIWVISMKISPNR